MSTSPDARGRGVDIGRFRREGLVLALLLCALQATSLLLPTGSSLRLFAADAPTVTLEALAPALVSPADGTLLIGPRGDRPTTAQLAGVRFEADCDYVLTVRADAGREFRLQIVNRDSGRPTWESRVPLRAEAGEFTLLLAAKDLPRSGRLKVWNAAPTDLLIQELRIHELTRAYGWARTAILPLGVAMLALFVGRYRRAFRKYFGIGQDRFADRLVAFFFLLACFQVFYAAPVQQLLDSKFSTAVSYRLITAGTLSLPSDFSHAEGETLRYQLQEIDGRLFHVYPNAVAVLNVPFVALFSAFDLAPLGPDGFFLRHRERRILFLAAALQAAVLCAVLFLLGRIFLRPAHSLALAGVFAFGTQIFSTISRSYWSHSWASLLMASGLYLLLAPRWKDRASAYVLSASLLSWSFFCRPPMALSIVALTVLVALTTRKYFLHFAATGFGWALLLAAYSQQTFHQLLPPYFLSSYVETGTLGAETLKRTYPEALLGTLFSPGRGLFVYLPFLALLAILLVRYWRQLPHKAWAVAALVVCFGHWQLIGTNKNWSAGGFGPRLFSDVLIWLYLLAILALVAWVRDPEAGRTGRGLIAATAVLLIVASVFIHTRGATARATVSWSPDSLWDWRRPQFLAGMTRPPEKKPLAERIADLALTADGQERMRLFGELVRDESLVERRIDGERLIARVVTWDHWTYGEHPALLVVDNKAPRQLVPRLALATWAEADVYPITVSVEDGEGGYDHVLESPGVREIELARVPANSTRLYVIRSNKAWSPGTKDQRLLGVQLRAAGSDE